MTLYYIFLIFQIISSNQVKLEGQPCLTHLPFKDSQRHTDYIVSRLYTENEALRRKFFTEMYGFDWPGLTGSC